MNNITIAILLNDVFLTKVFEEISKNHRDQLNFSIISNDDEIRTKCQIIYSIITCKV